MGRADMSKTVKATWMHTHGDVQEYECLLCGAEWVEGTAHPVSECENTNKRFSGDPCVYVAHLKECR